MTKVLDKYHLRRPPLRVQLTVLYAGLFMALVGFVLGVSGLLFGTSSSQAAVGHGRPFDAGGGGGRHFNVGPFVVALFAGVVALWLAWWIAGRFLRPLRAMNTTAQEISATNLHRRLELDGPEDELTELGRTLDELFGRLESSFESQRRFVANASHEMRTPLAGQRTLLQVALADPAADAESLRTVCEEVLVLGAQQERLIDALLTLASSERGIKYREPFDLAEVARTTVVARGQEAERRGVEIRTALASAPATGDANLIESMIANLLDNAIRYNAPGGNVDIVTERRAGAAQLSVRNTGPVVPAADVERLLRPFQRQRNERTGVDEGHGLGLAIVQAIVNAHGAVLAATSRLEGGLDVIVTFLNSEKP